MKWLTFLLTLLILFPVIPSMYTEAQVDDFSFSLGEGEYLGYGIRNLEAGDNFSVIFQVTGGDVNFQIMDEDNYNDWKNRLSVSSIHSVLSVSQHNYSFIVPADGTWVLCFDHDSSDTISVSGYIALNTEIPPLASGWILPENLPLIVGVAMFVIGIIFLIYYRQFRTPRKLAEPRPSIDLVFS